MKSKTKVLGVISALAILLSGMAVAASMDSSDAAITSGSAGSNATWTYDDVTKTMTISGTGAMSNFSATTNLGTGKTINTLIIEEGITSVGNHAFNGSTKITSISLPSSLVAVGIGAFHDSKSLTSIEIPDGVSSIGNSAFKGCFNLTDVSLPKSLTIVTTKLFQGCTALTSITIPDQVTSIEILAFADCTSLITAYVPRDATIHEQAFQSTTAQIIRTDPQIAYNPPANLTPITGANWYYTPTAMDGVTIGIDGAPWLSTAGNAIYGTPATPGDYTVTITLSKAGYTTSTHTFTLSVASQLVPTNSPTNGIIIYAV